MRVSVLVGHEAFYFQLGAVTLWQNRDGRHNPLKLCMNFSKCVLIHKIHAWYYWFSSPALFRNPVWYLDCIAVIYFPCRGALEAFSKLCSWPDWYFTGSPESEDQTGLPFHLVVFIIPSVYDAFHVVSFEAEMTIRNVDRLNGLDVTFSDVDAKSLLGSMSFRPHAVMQQWVTDQ